MGKVNGALTWGLRVGPWGLRMMMVYDYWGILEDDL